MSLDRFIGRGVSIDVRGTDVITGLVLEGLTRPEKVIILLYLGFGEKYHTEEYFQDAPTISEDFAKKVVELRVHMVWMEISGPDTGHPWLVHKILLIHDVYILDVYILESLTNLEALLGEKSFEIIALPAKLQSDAALVRGVSRIWILHKNSRINNKERRLLFLFLL